MIMKKYEIYTRSDGSTIEVRKMVLEHLNNAINYCRRKGHNRKYNMLRRERYRRTKVS